MQTLETPKRSEFSGMAAFYESELRPWLREKEADRRAAVTNFFLLTGSLGALALAVFLFGPFGSTNFHAALMIGLGAAALAFFLLNRTRGDIAHGLIERISGKLGFAYRSRFARPPYCATFDSLKLLPEFNREEWEDEIAGRYGGADFLTCEAHLQYKSSGKNSSIRTVFHGQLLMVDYHKRFLGRTVVVRDAGILNALTKPGAGFQRVGLASPQFEKAFEAWSTDQVEARELLDPLVLERFQELERLFDGKKIRAAFVDGKALVAVETGDRLNMGSMFAPLENPRRVGAILKALDAVFDLIDALTKPVSGRMDGAFSLSALKA